MTTSAGRRPRAEPELCPALANRFIGILANAGNHILSILGGLPMPVTTMSELAALDPEVEIQCISRIPRFELKMKAEMGLGITVEVASFATLAGELLETLLALPSDKLAERAGQPLAKAEQFLRQLRALRMLLKNNNSRSLRLSDLQPGAG